MPKLSAGLPLDRSKPPALGELRHKVIVCTTVERPDGDVSTIVGRPGVIEVHARITPLGGDEVLDYRAAFEVFRVGKPAPSHEIVIRTPPDVKIDLNHWVYWDDGVKACWLKVRFVEDIGSVRRFTAMQCSLETTFDRRSDPATQRLPPEWEEPEMGPVIEV